MTVKISHTEVIQRFFKKLLGMGSLGQADGHGAFLIL